MEDLWSSVWLTGSSTLRPRGERAAAALEARDAPTQAQVSARDAEAKTGLAALTALGMKRLQARPASTAICSEGLHRPAHRLAPSMLLVEK